MVNLMVLQASVVEEMCAFSALDNVRDITCVSLLALGIQVRVMQNDWLLLRFINHFWAVLHLADLNVFIYGKAMPQSCFYLHCFALWSILNEWMTFLGDNIPVLQEVSVEENGADVLSASKSILRQKEEIQIQDCLWH